MRKFLVAVALVLALAAAETRACTIVVLTDGERTLFCNNEDWEETRTRIWFEPAGAGHFGCAYVGFDNGWAQGGVNTEGLAMDWVSGFSEKWERDPKLKSVRGNPNQRMLEICRTVKEAIEFYRTHWEPDFARSRVMVADRSGASAVLGARNGKLVVMEASESRGFGYAGPTANERLKKNREVTISNGLTILRQCRQEGRYGTKYSNVFDLANGDIFVRSEGEEEPVKLNLREELRKGAHYYEFPKLRAQWVGRPLALPARMQRLPVDQAKAGDDPEPELTRRIEEIVRNARNGEMQEEHYTPELWQEISGSRDQMRQDLQALGDFERLFFVAREKKAKSRIYRYRAEFSGATIVQSFTVTADGKIAASESEAVEMKVKQ